MDHNSRQKPSHRMMSGPGGADLFLCNTGLYWKQGRDDWSASRLLGAKSAVHQRTAVTPLWPAFVGAGGEGEMIVTTFFCLFVLNGNDSLGWGTSAWGAEGLEATMPVTQSGPTHWEEETVKKKKKMLWPSVNIAACPAESGDYSCGPVAVQLGAHLQHAGIQSH